MKAFFAFSKKELMEYIRTYKLLILMLIFFVFGMMSPLSAKLLPELMSSLLPEGITITLAPPTAVDSWAQFYKNMSQIGTLLIVILFSGSISTELSKGTLINILTKGLKRPVVFLSKYVSACLLFSASYLVAFFTTYMYTLYFWPQKLDYVFQAALYFWIFGIFMIAVTLFASLLSQTNYASLLITGLVVVALYLLSFWKPGRDYNPLRLSSDNMNLLTGALSSTELVAPVMVTLILIFLLLGGGMVIFNKKQL